ncbi:putative exported protein [Caballeronia sordidicola]|uniref:Putative exported protein n=2 Tax=Caballeronia sordidicola TaxID=196367 RepID=A0A242M7Y7_CABSO|nr:putative exported protein [Caballeronia sordidicola]
MNRMMNNMTVQPKGNVDEDFVAMMIPHHQGAVDMAQAELRYGHNERLRRIAQEIIVEQMQEIAAMRLALGQPLGPSTPVPDQPTVPRTTNTPQAASQMHMTMPKDPR